MRSLSIIIILPDLVQVPVISLKSYGNQRLELDAPVVEAKDHNTMKLMLYAIILHQEIMRINFSKMSCQQLNNDSTEKRLYSYP